MQLRILVHASRKYFFSKSARILTTSEANFLKKVDCFGHNYVTSSANAVHIVWNAGRRRIIERKRETGSLLLAQVDAVPCNGLSRLLKHRLVGHYVRKAHGHHFFKCFYTSKTVLSCEKKVSFTVMFNS